jgi:hypothetical protein
MSLEWLAKQREPMWGGHLQRGEPMSDPLMREWIEDGWIKAVGKQGYILTDKGRAAINGRSALERLG